MFQFHIVRLKATGRMLIRTRLVSQFHIVRLKVARRRSHQHGQGCFNSI